MGTLLYIQASPRGERSHSIAAAEAFLEVYRHKNPEDTVLTLDLFEEDLPPFDGRIINAKYSILHGEEVSEEDRNAWGQVERIIEQFKSADKYLLATPMWNFNIPYRLKQYIDILVQPTYTVEVTPEGAFEGLVTGRPMVICAARGGAYPPGSESDMQKPYLELILGFIGITDIRFVTVEPTLNEGPKVGERARAEGIQQARELAAEF